MESWVVSDDYKHSLEVAKAQLKTANHTKCEYYDWLKRELKRINDSKPPGEKEGKSHVT